MDAENERRNLIGEWRALAESLGQLGLEILDVPPAPIGPKGFGEARSIAIMMMARTLSNLKGVLTLLDAGLIVEARVLVRCCLENAFWVAGIDKDGDEFIRRMLHEDMRGRQTLGELALSKKPTLLEEAEQRLKDLLRAIKKHRPDAQPLNPKGVANDGPLSDLYLLYGQLSADAAHPTITSLNRYVGRGAENEKVIDVEPQSKEDEVLMTLDWACNAMLGVCVGINQILGGSPAGRKLEAVADRYRDLMQASRQDQGDGRGA